MSLITIGVALIFLFITPFIWRKLVHPLEKAGWITGILASIFTILSYVVNELPTVWRYFSGVIAVCVLIITAVYPRLQRKSSMSLAFNPRFSHVAARLFYPPRRWWVKKRVLTKHLWEIWKQGPSHHKLMLVKDLRKAYYTGAYAWGLVTEGKVEWFSEDDQDIEEWCKKEGYILIKEDAKEENLLETHFEAEVVDKKIAYQLGEAILFRTRYRGKLINGFFSNQIFAPTGKNFSDSRDRTSMWAPDTLKSGDPNVGGELNGYVNHESRWSWSIPLDAPLGEYRIYMRAHNHFTASNRPTIAQSEDTFIVNQVAHSDALLNNKLMEVYSIIHSMVVRVNREIPRENALKLTVGAWVKASLIDFNNISAVFNQHVDELGDDHLKMWLAIEEEIKEKNGFWLGRDRQEWFDELEAEYNRFLKHRKG